MPSSGAHPRLRRLPAPRTAPIAPRTCQTKCAVYASMEDCTYVDAPTKPEALARSCLPHAICHSILILSVCSCQLTSCLSRGPPPLLSLPKCPSLRDAAARARCKPYLSPVSPSWAPRIDDPPRFRGRALSKETMPNLAHRPRNPTHPRTIGLCAIPMRYSSARAREPPLSTWWIWSPSPRLASSLK